MSPTHVSATHLSVHDSLVALHLMRIVSTDAAAMCMLLGNAGYAQPNTVQQQQQPYQQQFSEYSHTRGRTDHFNAMNSNKQPTRAAETADRG